MDVIYSLGHSDRSPQAFIKLLQRHGIEMVADIRRWPVSRFPQFSQEELVPLLWEQSIEYTHFEALGAFRPEGYEAWIQQAAWQEAYEQLVATAKRWTTVFMCAERSPQRCHRRFIARRLADDGWTIIHILDSGAAQETLAL